MGNSIDAAQQQALIIGLVVGFVVLAIVIIVITICVCCRKAERSIIGRSLKKQEKKYNIQRDELTMEQTRRRDMLNQKHDEIRGKYGLNHNNELPDQPKENIFSVVNERYDLK